MNGHIPRTKCSGRAPTVGTGWLASKIGHYPISFKKIDDNFIHSLGKHTKTFRKVNQSKAKQNKTETLITIIGLGHDYDYDGQNYVELHSFAAA